MNYWPTVTLGDSERASRNLVNMNEKVVPILKKIHKQ